MREGEIKATREEVWWEEIRWTDWSGSSSDAQMNPSRTEGSESNRLSVSDFLPAVASTVSALRDNAAFQSFSRRFSRRTMSSPEMCWPVPMRAIGAQNLLTMPGGVSTAGYLHKKGGSQFSLMKWPLRYIIIHKGCVYYFKSSTSPAPQGAFSLNGYNRVMRAAEETTSSNVFPFKIVHFSKKHRTWFFSAASEDERRKWMRYLRREIDYYNDRKESHISSDSDSDADSFYGTIERPMEIKHRVETTEDDYVDEEDDEDEEDYVKPDSECSLPHPDRPLGPPPAYPPPPVPAAVSSRHDPSSGFPKGLPPPIPPQHRNPTSPLPKKPPPVHPPPIISRETTKGLPPQLPSVSSIPKSSSPSSKTDLKAISQSCSGGDKRDWTPPPSVSVHCPATLPICENLREKLLLNGPPHPLPNTGGTQSLGPSCPRVKPSLPLRQPANTRSSPQLVIQTGPSHTPVPSKPTVSPALKPGTHKWPAIPKPPPPSLKPPVPSAKPKSGTALQRPSPDGESFKRLMDEKPTEFRRKWDATKHRTGHDSDDDYENVQLPNSVFIDSTETCFVEKLFRECAASPPDGLYGIRNSGTKTAKVLVVWDVGINKARNYRLFEESDSVFLESDVTFPNLPSLIEHYHRSPLPHHDSLRLQLPYTQTLTS